MTSLFNPKRRALKQFTSLILVAENEQKGSYYLLRGKYMCTRNSGVNGIKRFLS
jgi:hypothetical protein